MKVTAGSAAEATGLVDVLYRRIILAGTHKVSGIRVAETAKITENTPRGANAFIFSRMRSILKRI